MSKKKWFKWLLIALLTITLCLNANYNFGNSNHVIAQTENYQQEGKLLYEQGKYPQAVQVLEQALVTYQSQGNILKQAATLSNLSLAYQQLGLWDQAQTTISQSLALLQNNSTSSNLPILAQTLNIQGRLQLSQGKAEAALETWQQSQAIFTQIDDSLGIIRAQINQVQALRSLGFYRRALQVVNEVKPQLETQPDSITTAVSWRSLGNILRLVGDFNQADEALQNSLAIAQKLNSTNQISSAWFSLGNLARIQSQKIQTAQEAYQKAIATANSPTNKIQAQLNLFSLFLEKDNLELAQNLLPEIEQELQLLPPSRKAINARINLATNLIQSSFSSLSNYQKIAQILAIAVQQGNNLGDRRAEALALVSLGKVYEQNQQWLEAQKLTQQALNITQQVKAPEIRYRAAWQLGRLLKQQGREEEAIAAYDTAINLLKDLRADLVAVNTDVKFSFRESVEPVYRELVSLLLAGNSNKNSQAKLERARKVIESLQLAELDNFFRSACLNSTPVAIEQVDQRAAVIYPIILSERLEVILHLPDQPLRHYATNLPKEEVEATIQNLRRGVTNRLRRQFKYPSQKVYDWLIRPVENDLAQSNIDTLVFILDGILRNVPMATLHDGTQYLAEKYAIALTPGLELLASKPLVRGQIKVLSGGLSEGRQGFNPLPGVEIELNQIQNQVNTEVFLNQNFTKTNVQTAIDAVPFPIIHFATHGKFSSQAEETFIVTWDGKINVNELNSLLRSNEFDSTDTIELLVFSACETATGDKRAALGIAGVAVKAGARSTMASLWSVNDEATAKFMVQFYQELANQEVTKAEALRRAQMAILQDPKYRQHPYYWAPFVLVGNWL